MTSASNAPEQPYEPAAEHVDRTGDSPERSPSLDEVVRETLDAHGGSDRLAPEVRDAFAEIARRRAAAETLEISIVQDLVGAVLTCRFDQFKKQPELRAAAANRIAQTLWEDSPSRERLERLWTRLREDS